VFHQSTSTGGTIFGGNQSYLWTTWLPLPSTSSAKPRQDSSLSSEGVISAVELTGTAWLLQNKIMQGQ